MKVLVTGARGQVGAALVASAPPAIDLVATDRAQLDISDRGQVIERVGGICPHAIINAAAYTAVDQAESEPELAFRINRDGAANLAEAAQACGARLIQLSTDYVFDGRKPMPYLPDDSPNPLSVYGESKLAGECAARERAEGSALVVRTAWVYAAQGRNFVNTMRRLLSERKEVRVVCDQIGTPTHAASLAQALWRMLERDVPAGIYHWTDAGVASWYDFAVAIRTIISPSAGSRLAAIVPIPTHEYVTAARRPPCAVLDKTKTWRDLGHADHWMDELNGMLEPKRP